MNGLLFLAHRIPYPPNKGDKIRSYHLLRYLAGRHRVYLGAFVDDPDDMQHREYLEKICAGTCLLPLDPLRARVRSLRGLLGGEALTIPYYADRRMREWVDRVVGDGAVDRALIFSSAMAQYVLGESARRLVRVADYVDVDSDKWRQYGESRRWPMSWIYRREGRRLLEFERTAAARFDQVVFVSAAEAGLFQGLAPEVAGRVSAVENGVDTDYFRADAPVDNPYSPAERPLVFTGAMDYWANVDAVQWFAGDVMPLIREQVPECRFYIVGSRPADAVRRLAKLPGVVVTGSVPDVRPWLAHAAAAVAPLRIARGVQNKVLEAMAMHRVVILTPQAMDGLADCAVLRRWLAETPRDLAAHAIRLLRDGDRGDGDEAGTWVREHYDWDRNLSRLAALFAASPAAAAVAPDAAAGISTR